MLRTLLVLLLCATACHADVRIRPKHCIPNRGDGYCLWCATETIGRHRGDKRLYGLVEHYSQWPSTGATEADFDACCNSLGVKYHIHRAVDLAWVKAHTDIGVPVIVCTPNHALVAVDVDGDWVKTVDSNRIKSYWWYHKNNLDAWMIEILPPETQTKKPKCCCGKDCKCKTACDCNCFNGCKCNACQCKGGNDCKY